MFTSLSQPCVFLNATIEPYTKTWIHNSYTICESVADGVLQLRNLLSVPPTKTVTFERYSDSAGPYVTLDSNNPSVYKQLYRAAKAKLKLRIKATVTDANALKVEAPQPAPVTPDRLTSHRYVPPMNPDPLQLHSLSAALNKASLVATPPTSVPATQAVGELQRQAYAQFVRDSMTTYVKGLHSPNAPVVQLNVNGESKPEAPVAVKDEVEDEAPVPCTFSDRASFYAELANLSKSRPPSLRAVDQDFHVPAPNFTVCCNNCNSTIPDAHWHCSICDDGDYDICGECVAKGIHCGVEGHFLIKRSIEKGKVISSTTETLPSKAIQVENGKEVPGAFTSNKKEEHLPETLEMSRTCNSCVNGAFRSIQLLEKIVLTKLAFEESNFVTCMVCEDYDLCIPCHVGMKHGHHPNHAFAPVSEESSLDIKASLLCAPGRNIRHFAICDGCDKVRQQTSNIETVADISKDIYGVRHKCMNCPDWDYCSRCAKNARYTHPGHRLVPLYEIIPNPPMRPQVHHGINCDGPLCKGKLGQYWIVGDRYKCAVCHDTDFCASCEALPTHRHNRTHPLIKFRTPVRNVSVTTLGEKENGEAMCTMGDKLPQTSSKSTETTPAAPSANAATQVQTVAEVKPLEPVKEEVVKQEPVTPQVAKVEAEQEKAATLPATQLQAHFITDATPDGSKVRMGFAFQQVWVLRNPGPYAWPAGCSVRFVGGDNMFNVDDKYPSSTIDIASATESNVIKRAVEAGEEVAFYVTMKAPERAGKAISYWRLKAADGTSFGHKLWCDIDVYAPEVKPAAVESSQIEHVEDVTKEAKEEVLIEVKQEAKEVEQSQMIFPKLDKESPISSTYQEHKLPSAAPSPITTAEADLLEDVESLELDDEDSSDDGFLTDEEYEILDVDGDEEAINGKK